ncbi:MAG: YihY/virulence factor BrkB family protein [Stellaceae bacterium]
MDEQSQRERIADTAGTHGPRSEWKHVLWGVFYGISEDRVFLIAAGVTFYAVVALFPGIAAIVSIYGLFANPVSIAGHLGTLSGVAPGGGIDVIKEQLTRLTHQTGTALSFGFAASLVIALWFSNSGMTGLFEALNAVYEEKEQRSLIKYYATTLTFTFGAIILVLVSIAIIVAIPIVLKLIPNAGAAAILLNIVRWPLLFVLVAGALALVYRYAPCRAAPQWRRIIWTSLLAAAVWLAVSALFSWYVANFGSYNKTYGSLGAIVGFMTWMWLSTVVVLLGAKLDMETARSRDITRSRSDAPPAA